MGTSGLDELLRRLAAGDDGAVHDILPRIYQELRSIAGLYMRRERAGHSLQPTALVHEAYFRLLGDRASGPPVESRSHFLALAARAMREVLVEHARARGRQKRGGGAEHVEIHTDLGLVRGPDIEILELHDALLELHEEDPRAAQAVELRYFGGLTADEAGRVLHVSARTVERDLRSARAWLRGRLDRDVSALGLPAPGTERKSRRDEGQSRRTGPAGRATGPAGRPSGPAGRAGGPAGRSIGPAGRASGTASSPRCGPPEAARLDQLRADGGSAESGAGEQEPPQRIGRYAILGTLGKGGTGTVFLARDPSLERNVALKRLSRELAPNPEAKELLREEARTLAALQHPNIATVFSLEDDEDGPFLTLERVDGPSLAAICRQEAIPYGRALEIVRQVAHAMEAAAQVGIVHGDLTPANVLLTPDGSAKVVDFGLARRTRSDDESTPVSTGLSADPTNRELVVAGTPGYMSPEQTRGELPSSAGDLFAFGCLLFEALTGLPAFPGQTPWERIAATRDEEPRWDLLDSGPAGRITPLARRCLAKTAENRPTSIRQARRRIEVELLRLRSERGPQSRKLRSDPPARTTHLPLPRDRFVGREDSLARIVSLLADRPLVSLQGPGGVGKTRLALEAASLLEADGEDVVFVDLTRTASLQEALVDALEIQVGANESGTTDSRQVVERRLAEFGGIVVLDGCESRRDAVTSLLTRPDVLGGSTRFLITSRARLGIAGEERVDLLPLPASAASELFLRRAEETGVGHRFEAGQVTQLCSELDGLPLALELAAARLRTVSLEGLLGRVRDLRTLGSTRGDRPERHRDLTALVAWSEQLLLPEAQRLFYALGHFAPGWDLDAVEAVAEPLALPKWRILDLLTELVDHSLVIVDRADRSEETVCYRMLGSISSYAASRCQAGGEAEAVTARIGSHYLTHVEAETLRLGGPESRSALDALTRTRPNWLRCLERIGLTAGASHPPVLESFPTSAPKRTPACGSRDEEGASQATGTSGSNDPEKGDDRLVTGLRFVAALDAYWTTRGLWPEARHYSDAALGLVARWDSPDPLPPGVPRPLGHVYNLRGNVALYAGDLDRAEACYRRSLAIGENLGDTAILGRSIHNLGGVALHRERWNEAIGWFERSIRHDEAHGALRRVALAHANLGLVEERRDNPHLSNDHYARALDVARKVGDDRLLGFILNNVAAAALVLGRMEAARAAIDESLTHHRRLGDPHGEAGALLHLGIWCMEVAEPGEALGPILSSIGLVRNLGDAYSLLKAIAVLGIWEQRFGQPHLAVRIHAFAQQARDELSAPAHTARHLREIEGSIEALRESLGPVLFEREWEEGRRQSLDSLLSAVVPEEPS